MPSEISLRQLSTKQTGGFITDLVVKLEKNPETVRFEVVYLNKEGKKHERCM